MTIDVTFEYGWLDSGIQEEPCKYANILSTSCHSAVHHD